MLLGDNNNNWIFFQWIIWINFPCAPPKEHSRNGIVWASPACFLLLSENPNCIDVLLMSKTKNRHAYKKFSSSVVEGAAKCFAALHFNCFFKCSLIGNFTLGTSYILQQQQDYEISISFFYALIPSQVQKWDASNKRRVRAS